MGIIRRIMAPFNQRQIGYIQAIAGRQQHRTLICGGDDRQINSSTAPWVLYKPPLLNQTLVTGGLTAATTGASGNPTNAKSLLMQNWLLDGTYVGFDSRSVHNNTRLEKQDFDGLHNC